MLGLLTTELDILRTRMMLGAAQAVECIEGCGNGEPSALVIAGFAVALLGLGAALMGVRSSNESLKISRAQHDRFLAQVEARADFKLTIRLDEHLEGEEITIARKLWDLNWHMKVENIGNKAATNVRVTLLVPQFVLGVGWTSEAGIGLKDQYQHRLLTDEMLETDDGDRVEAEYMTKSIGRVSTREPYVCFAEAAIKMPLQIGEKRVVPVKFKVSSDDLPDKVEARWTTHETVFVRVGENPPED